MVSHSPTLLNVTDSSCRVGKSSISSVNSGMGHISICKDDRPHAERDMKDITLLPGFDDESLNLQRAGTNDPEKI